MKSDVELSNVLGNGGEGFLDVWGGVVDGGDSSEIL